MAALERYMFMGAGDWAAALVQELCGASLLVALPGPHDLPRILDAAILVRLSSASPPPACRPGMHFVPASRALHAKHGMLKAWEFEMLNEKRLCCDRHQAQHTMSTLLH